jgi:hypothetical protein
VTGQTFLLIESEQKDLLVRSENRLFPAFDRGERIELCALIKGRERRCIREVVARRTYPTMLEIVDHEDLDRLAHGTNVQTLSYFARIFRPDQEEAEAVVHELKVVEPMEEPS